MQVATPVVDDTIADRLQHIEPGEHLIVEFDAVLGLVAGQHLPPADRRVAEHLPVGDPGRGAEGRARVVRPDNNRGPVQPRLTAVLQSCGLFLFCSRFYGVGLENACYCFLSTNVALDQRKAYDAPAVGAPAPAFSLPRDGAGTVSLSDFSGRKLVLYFYPRADTPGCTREAQAFSQLSAKFTAANTAILGVSADPVAGQDAFKAKYRLSIPLASDETHRMLEAYGVWGKKSMYGKTFMGIARTTFLIGPDGRIARTWAKVRVDGHAEEVMAAAKAL
jgi:thioredoxin-dependent peroxiredoxin